MASIVELRDLSDEKLEEKLENAREEMFNLRFQHASARLDDLSQLKRVRREIAQLETVLNQRELAIEAAIIQPGVAEAIAGQEWDADAHFSYEESAWEVSFIDEDDKELIATKVNLNKKMARGRKARRKVAA
jgi:large subunit ribosomal protein L29